MAWSTTKSPDHPYNSSSDITEQDRINEASLVQWRTIHTLEHLASTSDTAVADPNTDNLKKPTLPPKIGGQHDDFAIIVLSD